MTTGEEPETDGSGRELPLVGVILSQVPPLGDVTEVVADHAPAGPVMTSFCWAGIDDEPNCEVKESEAGDTSVVPPPPPPPPTTRFTVTVPDSVPRVTAIGAEYVPAASPLGLADTVKVELWPATTLDGLGPVAVSQRRRSTNRGNRNRATHTVAAQCHQLALDRSIHGGTEGDGVGRDRKAGRDYRHSL